METPSVETLELENFTVWKRMVPGNVAEHQFNIVIVNKQKKSLVN